MFACRCVLDTASYFDEALQCCLVIFHTIKSMYVVYNCRIHMKCSLCLTFYNISLRYTLYKSNDEQCLKRTGINCVIFSAYQRSGIWSEHQHVMANTKIECVAYDTFSWDTVNIHINETHDNTEQTTASDRSKWHR